MASKKSVRKSKLREYVEAVIIAVFLALLIRAFIVQAFKIPSGSMIPTLLVGDHILVNKFTYGIKVPFIDSRMLIFNQPKRGDVIVFSFPKNREQEECTSITRNISARFGNAWSSGNPFYLFRDDCKDFIKRVIGVGGDRIEVRNKRVYVNSIPLDEPFAIHNDLNIEGPPRDNFGPFTVPRGSFFVMGDNRDQSYDSRFWGVVDMDEIRGKAFIFYWSWDSDGSLLNQVRWSRIGKLIH
ncbi:MAG TPA: signal peptidase I [Nitrospiraceae bacterium]|nr:signal peptidase I [Nitrospiraceae bacterium]